MSINKKIFVIVCFLLLSYVNVFAEGSINVSKKQIELENGDSTSLLIEGDNVAGVIEIISSDSNVASVDQNSYFFDTSLGDDAINVTITGKNSGTATISVILKDVATFDNEELTGTEEIEVIVNEKSIIDNQVIGDVPKTNLDINIIVLIASVIFVLGGVSIFLYIKKEKEKAKVVMFSLIMLFSISTLFLVSKKEMSKTNSELENIKNADVLGSGSTPIYRLKNGWHRLPSAANENVYEWAYYENNKETKRVSQLILSHRGWGDAPENSLEAIKRTKANGYNGVEVDVRFTKDSVPVLYHDYTLKRLASNTDLSPVTEEIYISDLTYDELINNYVFNITSNGEVKEEYNDNKITKFEDALKYVKENKMFMQIELKDGMSEQQVASLVRIVHNYDMDNVVAWLSYYKEELKFVNKYDDDEILEYWADQGSSMSNEEFDNQLRQTYNELKTANNLVKIDNRISGMPEAWPDLGFVSPDLPDRIAQYPNNYLTPIPQGVITVDNNNIELTLNTEYKLHYGYNGDGIVACVSSNVNYVTCQVDQTKNEVVINPIKYTKDNITITLKGSQGVGYSIAENVNVKCVYHLQSEINSKDNSIKINGDKIDVQIPYNYTLTYGEIKKKMNITGDTIVIKRADGVNVSNDNEILGTGSKIILDSKEYVIIIDGDINKDGKITALDYVAIRLHMLNNNVIVTGSIEFKAADINNDDTISDLDYINIKNKMLESV